MSKSADQSVDFQAVGEFIGVIFKNDDKIKYLRVMISAQEYRVKLPKELSHNFDPNLSIGSWLEISGTKTIGRKKGVLKLEALSLSITSPPSTSSVQGSDLQTAIAKKKKSACILICQKSDCWQHGGKEVYQQLEEELRDRGISDQVQLQKTGCQKQCKKAPNLVIMPNKDRHSYVKSSQVNGLLNRYFGDRFN